MLADEFIKNMDAMDKDDLRDHSLSMIRLELTNQGDKNCRKSLVSYATTKLRAMTKRTEGDIPEALRLEKICEQIYMQLPVHARW